MRTLWAMAAGVLAVVLAAGTPLVAHAEDPVDFGSSKIVDRVGALAGREDDVLAAFDTLFASTGTDLYVAYVETFTGVADRQEWADQTADINGMGTNDVLLAVATEDREYQLSIAPAYELSDTQLQEVQAVAIEPALRENDWAGAAIGAAAGLGQSLAGLQVAAPDVVPGSATPGGGGGGSILGFALLGALALVVVLFFVLRRRGRRQSSGSAPGGAPPSGWAPPEPAEPISRVRQRAGQALVHTDDAVKTSEQELGFAIAQYGDEAASGFSSALENAREHLTRAFTLQQRLDDVEPDTEDQQRAWYAEIIELCARANAVLDEQAEGFDELRQLEKHAPQELAAVRSASTALEETTGPAAERVASLQAAYADAVVSTVSDNVDQARDRVAFARAALAEADTDLASGDTGAAAVGIRAAEDAVEQARLLLEAIDRLGSDLQKAAAGLDARVADLEADLATAAALPPGGDGYDVVAGAVRAAEQSLARVAAARAAGRSDPLALAQELEVANARMDAALQGVRDAEVQARRARDALAQALLSARSRVSAASDFITARRGAVGAEARTRVAEAGRLVAVAESQGPIDPAAALAAAGRADSLAADAIALAQRDVDRFSPADGDDSLGGLLGGGGSGRGSGMMGAVLGGILIDQVLGGGGGMFGGGRSQDGTWGGGRRGGGGSFGGGIRGPGSFGGVGTRSRRGGGGRF